VAIFPIRVFGDPVLRQRAVEIEEIDGKIVRLSEEMLETMYAAPGVGLAAPQVASSAEYSSTTSVKVP